MFERREQPKPVRSGGVGFLVIMLAVALSNFLDLAKLLPSAEAFLVGWTVAFTVGYWVPPRPEVGFLRWTCKHLIMIGCVYVLVLKLPLLFTSQVNRLAAYGIGFALLLTAVLVWRRRKNTIGFGRA